MDWMPYAVREGIFTILFISGPLVVLAAGLGLIIGVIQAATQVQEQTLGSAVKVIGLFLALIIFGFAMFQYMRQYTLKSVEHAFNLIPTLGTYIKPRQNFLSVPVGGEEEVMPLPPVIAPPSQEEDLDPSKAKTRYSGGVLSDPDIVDINSGAQPEKLALPQKQQTRTVNKQIKAQPLNPSPKQQPLKSSPKAQPLKPASEAITKPSTKKDTSVKKPRRKARKSLSDSILKLKDSVGAQ